VNPAAVALNAGDVGRGRVPRALLAFAVGAGAPLAVILIADGLLDFLEIEPETFRIAAGIVMLVAAGVTAWRAMAGPRTPAEPAPGIYAGWPLIANPAAVIAAVSLAADHHDAKIAAAAILASAVAGVALAAGFARAAWAAAALSGLTAALLAAIAAGLIVDGVRDI
jgi:small neutral amino acid transporter SnatA (MarC family)